MIRVRVRIWVRVRVKVVFCIFGMTKLFFGMTNLKITFGMKTCRNEDCLE